MLNDVGYQLLQQENTKTALDVFKLNVEEYPTSSNVYDSLGEAYVTAGDRKRAEAAYKKALKLDPENENAKQKLSELKGSKKKAKKP